MSLRAVLAGSYENDVVFKTAVHQKLNSKRFLDSAFARSK
jgi:hypothetical protein